MREMFVAEVARSRLGYRWFEAVTLPTERRGEPSVTLPLSLMAGKSEAEVDRLCGGLEPQEAFGEICARYDPFEEEPGLFLVLAGLKRTREAIVGFADRYGTLVGDQPGTDPDRGTASFRQWAETIEHLRNAVELWMAINSKDEEVMERHVVWKDGGRYSPGRGFSTPLVHVKDSQGRRPSLFINKSAKGPPYLSFRSIPENRSGKPSRMDLIAFAQRLLENVLTCKANWSSAVPKLRRTDTGLKYQIVLRSLDDVVWAQFMTAVVESQVFQHCLVCNAPFEMAPGVHRSDKLTCSNACRQTLSRRRRREAQRLRGEGYTLRQIVKAMGAKDMATAKKWLGEG